MQQLNTVRMSTVVDSTKVIKSDTSLRASTLMEEIETSSKYEEDESANELLDYSIPVIDTKKSYLDDGFVFGLEGSGIERPKGKIASVVVDSDFLETTPKQVAIVSITMAVHAALIASSISEIVTMNDGNLAFSAAESCAIMFSSWVFADLGSGVLHWSVDNYGNGKTPVMGSIIAAFQGHHSAPWTITQRGFCNNVHKLCTPFGIPTMLLISAISGPIPTLFFAIFCIFEILSQEFHKWSHMTKAEVPSWVNSLQDSGLSISRIQHVMHHRAPYDGNYCIVSGYCNEFMDNSGFFRRLEHIVYNINGVEANSWKLDAKLREKTLRGEYALE